MFGGDMKLVLLLVSSTRRPNPRVSHEHGLAQDTTWSGVYPSHNAFLLAQSAQRAFAALWAVSLRASGARLSERALASLRPPSHLGETAPSFFFFGINSCLCPENVLREILFA